MHLPLLILASASPRREELLRRLGVPFHVAPAHLPEAKTEQLTAWELSQLNAYRKARSVAKQFPDALVLGADTVVALGTRLFGKPTTLTEARAMLRALQGRTHQVVTGVCLLHLREHRQRVFADATEVTFRRLTPEAIWLYLDRVNPFDKAGAYAIQEQHALIVDRIAGSFSNVVGLPLERLEAELASWDRPSKPASRRR
jgi:septum formation protein